MATRKVRDAVALVEAEGGNVARVEERGRHYWLHCLTPDGRAFGFPVSYGSGTEGTRYQLNNRAYIRRMFKRLTPT